MAKILLRFRIVMGYSSWASLSMGIPDCNGSQSGYYSTDVTHYGEVEDYGFFATAPAACSGTPSPGVANLVTSGFCLGQVIHKLQYVPQVIYNTPGFNHQWQVRQNGGSFLDIPGATTPSSLSYTGASYYIINGYFNISV